MCRPRFSSTSTASSPATPEVTKAHRDRAMSGGHANDLHLMPTAEELSTELRTKGERLAYNLRELDKNLDTVLVNKEIIQMHLAEWENCQQAEKRGDKNACAEASKRYGGTDVSATQGQESGATEEQAVNGSSSTNRWGFGVGEWGGLPNRWLRR